MNWISKLERKFGRYAINNLSTYIIAAYAVGFVISLVMPELYTNWLCLDIAKILHGQIWRLITFIIQPPSTSLIFIIFALYLYYFIGTSLENAWGAFRFNLFFFSGILFHIIGAFAAYFITKLVLGYGISFNFGTTYLNLSMFFAFAALFPDVQLLLFFVIPVKIKWLAWLDAAFFAYSIISGISGGTVYGIGSAIAAVMALMNFVIFFVSTRRSSPYRSMHSRQETRRKQQYYQQVQQARQQTGADGSRHRCTICGRTEISNPELEFRYCSKCSGAHEYCNEHLFTHTHI